MCAVCYVEFAVSRMQDLRTGQEVVMEYKGRNDFIAIPPRYIAVLSCCSLEYCCMVSLGTRGLGSMLLCMVSVHGACQVPSGLRTVSAAASKHQHLCCAQWS